MPSTVRRPVQAAKTANGWGNEKDCEHLNADKTNARAGIQRGGDHIFCRKAPKGMLHTGIPDEHSIASSETIIISTANQLGAPGIQQIQTEHIQQHKQGEVALISNVFSYAMGL